VANVAIAAQALDKWFGEGEARTRALMQVSFEAEFNEMLFIVGPSGSGKTTLLSVISGILRPDSGRAMVDGVDIWSLGADALADFRLGRIGFVFQDYHLFPRLTTVENVAIPLILRHVAWDTALDQAMHYLDVVGLKNRAQLPPVKLSGGEQQRVALARAFVVQPAVLLADEPTGSLDKASGERVMQLMMDLNQASETTLVLVTHDLAISQRCQRRIAIEAGEQMVVG
jgi:putative ABC transport system ATP-binding protein